MHPTKKETQTLWNGYCDTLDNLAVYVNLTKTGYRLNTDETLMKNRLLNLLYRIGNALGLTDAYITVSIFNQ